MAKIVRQIEDVFKISENSFIIELEEIEFVDDSGRTKSFKIGSVVLVSAKRCIELDDTVDWNKINFHLIVCPEEVKLQ